MSILIKQTASSFSSQFDYDEVGYFSNLVNISISPYFLLKVNSFYAMHEAGSGRRAVAQALESIEMNMHWLQLNEQASVNWFTNNREREARSARSEL